MAMRTTDDIESVAEPVLREFHPQPVDWKHVNGEPPRRGSRAAGIGNEQSVCTMRAASLLLGAEATRWGLPRLSAA